jgi:uncharacterized protein (TIRG00374 family)
MANMPSSKRAPIPTAESSASDAWGRRRWFLIAIAALYLICALLVFRSLDRSTLERALAMPWALLAALLGLSLFNYAIRAWRWVALSSFLRFDVPRCRNVLYYLAGYALTATPGKAGEAVRLWFLKAGHGIGYVRSIPIMLADRLLDMWAVLTLALLCFVDVSGQLWQGIAVTAVVLLVSVPIVAPLRFVPLLGLGLRLAPRRRRAWAKARRLLRSMAALSHWRTYGLTFLPSVVGWAAEGLSLYLLLRYFGADVSELEAIFVFSFSMIVGAISMLPGGLGSTEVTAVVLLRALGVDLDVAVACTALVRVSTFWFAVGIGAALLPAAIGAAARSGARWSASHAIGSP